MIDAIIKDYLSDKITPIWWVDKYGGLTYRAEKRDVVDVEGQQVTVVSAAYPVSCDVDGRACWEQQRYADLVPNTARKSVLYWEAPDGMTLTKRDGRFWTFEGNARLVVWLNLKKLGVADCAAPPSFALQLIRELTTTIQASDGSLQGASISVSLARLLPRRLDLFQQYTYADYQHLLMYPNDFFALDFKLSVMLDVTCVESPTETSPIAC